MRRLLIAAAGLAAGCAPATIAAGAAAGDSATAIRFAIEADSAAAGPVWVALNGPGGEVGWIRVTLDGELVYLQPRCEIADCGMPPVVCGAALPFVRNLTAGGDRRVAFVWDGTVSTVDSVADCERRRPAAPGTYVAQLCWSREAVLDGGGDPEVAVMGRLVSSECVDRTFTLDTREVVVRP